MVHHTQVIFSPVTETTQQFRRHWPQTDPNITPQGKQESMV